MHFRMIDQRTQCVTATGIHDNHGDINNREPKVRVWGALVAAAQPPALGS